MSNQHFKRNPYVAGKAIGNMDGFFGREDILHAVQDALSSGHQSAIVLAGQRRIGKTSILLQLQRRLAADLFYPVYFDLMDRAGDSLGRVLSDLASTIAGDVEMKKDLDFSDDQKGTGFQHEFLPSLYSALGPTRRPVLLLDEFDVLDTAAERNLDPDSAARKLFPYLRRLMEQDARIAFVFVVGRKVDELSIQFKAAFKAALFKKVSVLDLEAARKLVLTADREGTLTIQAAAVDRILALTSGHPLFTQLICQILWDSAHIHSPETIPEVSPAAVDGLVERALEAGENVFQWIWDGLPPAERIISAAIARATQEHHAVTEEEILATLQGNGIRILTRELHIAPETLVDWEVLRRADGGYEFFIELMRSWVQSRKPLLKVKSELDRIVQPADELFRSADMIYRRGDHSGVEQLLQQALRINSNHVGAKLLLGEYFLEEKRSPEAVAILEEAFKYDEDSARYPLIRALLQQGARQETSGQVDQALESYERVLKLSPKERNAGERRNAILVRRGELCLEAGDLEGAQIAFSLAGATDKFELLNAARRKQRVADLAQQFRALLDGKQLEKAMPVVRELMSLDPENGEWKAHAIAIEQQATLERNYAEGIGALATGDNARAIRALAEVVHVRPDYQDAAERLAQAVTGTKAPASLPPPVPNFAAAPVVTDSSWQKRFVSHWKEDSGLRTLTWVLIALVALLFGLAHLGRDGESPPVNNAQADGSRWKDKVSVHEQNIQQTSAYIEMTHSATAKTVLVALLPPSDFVVTGGDDGVVRVWNPSVRYDKPMFQLSYQSAIKGLIASRDGTLFVVRTDDNKVRVLRITSVSKGYPVIDQLPISFNGTIGALALSPDGKTVVTVLPSQNMLFLSDTKTGQSVGGMALYNGGDVDLSFGYRYNGGAIAVVAPGIRFLSFPALQALNYLDHVSGTGITWASAAPVIALRAWTKRQVAIWPIDNEAPENVIQTESAVNCMCFSPGADELALGTDGGLLAFKRTDGTEFLRGPNRQVASLDCDANFARIAVGGTDGKALLFGQTGTPIHRGFRIQSSAPPDADSSNAKPKN